MNFVYENIDALENFVSCADFNTSGIRRFAPSVLAGLAAYRLKSSSSKTGKLLGPRRYIIATGVNHHPYDWTGGSYGNPQRASAFSFLSRRYLNDLQVGNAMLLFDQSLEGHQTSWLWDWFHTECEQYKISPKAIIYVTGNQLAPEQYNVWANKHNLWHRITVIAYSHFEYDVVTMADACDLPNTYLANVDHKAEYLSEIKTYNCLQKRLRPHRLWFYTQLYKEGLLDNGLVSMNPFTTTQSHLDGQTLPDNLVKESNTVLPLLVYGKNNNEHDDNYYIRRIVKDVYFDTWISIVSEVAYANSDQSVFLSEKTFKAIACCHPFVILGSKRSLEKLRALGYKTFDGWIDESYDTLEPFERLQAITKIIKQVDDIPDKLSWYKSMREILEHNYNTLYNNRNALNPAIGKLADCYNNYFK